MKLPIYRNLIFLLTAGISFLFAPLIHGQPHLILEYADDEFEVHILDETGTGASNISIGDAIFQNYTVRTGAGTAEFRLIPNGSILKMDVNTIMKVDFMEFAESPVLTTDSGQISAMEDPPGRKNTFSLVRGKLRTVAAAATTETYLVRTPSLAAGVRGTDFIIDASRNDEGAVAVFSGAVDLFFFADNRVFRATPETSRRFFTDQTLQKIKENFQFKYLDPSSVIQAGDTEIDKKPFDFEKRVPSAVPQSSRQQETDTLKTAHSLDKPHSEAKSAEPSTPSPQVDSSTEIKSRTPAEGIEKQETMIATPVKHRLYPITTGGFAAAFLPVHNMAEICGIGFGGGADLLFLSNLFTPKTNQPALPGSAGSILFFGFTFEYMTFSGTAPDVDNFFTVTTAGNIAYRLSLLPFAGLLLQGRGGFGFSTLTYKDSTGEEPARGFHPYLAAGAGIETLFGRVIFHLSGLYRVILEEDFTLYQGISIQAGARLGFPRL